MGADVPTAARMLLGVRLRSLRDAAGITGEQAATAIGSSHTKVSRIESGRVAAQPEDVKKLLDLFGISASADRDALLTLAHESHQLGWWEKFSSDVLPDRVRHDLSLEAAADVIKIYDSQAVPALLQTPAYARALCTIGPRYTWRAGMDPWILARRRQLLQDPSSPHLWALIGAGTLGRAPDGDSDVLREQLEHLMSAAATPDIAIQVIPEGAPIELATPGPFTMLRFMQQGLPDFVLFEQLTGTSTLAGGDDAEYYRELFDLIAALAYTTDESKQALAEAKLSLE